MNTTEKYNKYALVKEMLETAEVVKKFNKNIGTDFISKTNIKKKIFFTGEGSSRIFPAKNSITNALRDSSQYSFFTEGGTQSLEYNLADHSIFAASNSGKTKEVVRLFNSLKKNGHDSYYGLTATADTPVDTDAIASHVLSCGKEDAVAATKSVVEQGLFYHSIINALNGKSLDGLEKLSTDINDTLTLDIDPKIIEKLASATTLYFAGRNNGVAEELTLKTNEITRKKSAYLEGTYAVHGIEEVMTEKDVVIIIDPFESEEEKFKECLVDGVGMNVVAISHRDTSFPTIKIPENKTYKEYLELCAGWSVLVEIGISLGIDLDKPVRARKIGNEFIA